MSQILYVNIRHPHLSACLLCILYRFLTFYWLLFELVAKELLEEVERLRSLLSERVQCSNNNENCADRQLKSPSRCQVNLTDLSKGSARRMTLKPSSGDQTEEAGVNPDASCQEVHILDREPEGVPIKGTPSNGAPEKLRLVCLLNFGG